MSGNHYKKYKQETKQLKSASGCSTNGMCLQDNRGAGILQKINNLKEPRVINSNSQVIQRAKTKNTSGRRILRPSTIKKSHTSMASKAKRKREMGRNSPSRFKKAVNFDGYFETNKTNFPNITGPIHTGLKPLTGAASSSKITFSRMTATSPPHNLQNWPDTAEKLSIIKNKNSNNTLTRMHQIRGRFGGQSIAANMFLGTAHSNNFHPLSHFEQMEGVLEAALRKKNNSVAEYQVKPLFGNVPRYILNRINKINKSKQWKKDMMNWCEEATPKEFEVRYTHWYRNTNAKIMSSGQVVKRLSAEV